jgi:hypothetical protein
VDAIGVKAPPTYVIWWMVMAATIRSACLSQILLNVRRLCRAHVYMLPVETAQEMARHSDTLARGSGSIPLLSQMLPQF